MSKFFILTQQDSSFEFEQHRLHLRHAAPPFELDRARQGQHRLHLRHEALPSELYEAQQGQHRLRLCH